MSDVISSFVQFMKDKWPWLSWWLWQTSANKQYRHLCQKLPAVLKLAMLIGKPVIRFTGFKPVTGLQNVLPVTEFID